MEELADKLSPAVSIIVPLYNAEKYIGECLISLLAQTFQDFEVIVIDDCSTDNSAAVVESYASKFGGRLRLISTEKNTGSPGEPGNIGVRLSRGKYLLIIDNDDTITPTALEELYPIAEKFEADFVLCEKFYKIPDKHWRNMELRKQLEPVSYQRGIFVDKPTLISIDVAERVKECHRRRFLHPLWTKLIRRDFIIENNIKFVGNLIQDVLATLCLVYCAKRYVRVPNVIYQYRRIGDSLSHVRDESLKHFRKYIRALTEGFDYLNDFLNQRKFFQKNLAMKYLALENYTRVPLNHLNSIYLSTPIYELDEILREELSNRNSVAFSAFIFNAMNDHRLYRDKFWRRAVELENIGKQDKLYISALEKSVATTKKQIAEIEIELARLKNQ